MRMRTVNDSKVLLSYAHGYGKVQSRTDKYYWRICMSQQTTVAYGRVLLSYAHEYG
jgi:hypothetical protein